MLYICILSYQSVWESKTKFMQYALIVFLFQDIDDVQVHYPGIIELMTDLQGTNCFNSVIYNMRPVMEAVHTWF